MFLPHLDLSAVTMYVILAVVPAGIGFGEMETESPGDTFVNEILTGELPTLATVTPSLFWPPCDRFPSWKEDLRRANVPLLSGYNSLSDSFLSWTIPRSLSITGFFTPEIYTVNVLSKG